MTALNKTNLVGGSALATGQVDLQAIRREWIELLLKLQFDDALKNRRWSDIDDRTTRYRMKNLAREDLVEFSNHFLQPDELEEIRVRMATLETYIPEFVKAERDEVARKRKANQALLALENKLNRKEQQIQ